MLKRLYVENLQGSLTREFLFHPDVNLFTGRNGSGKTTILKLIWYLLSANIERLPVEVAFDAIEMDTSYASVKIYRKPDKEEIVRFAFRYVIGGGEPVERDVTFEEMANEHSWVRRANRALAGGPKTTFFPTFRRLEGGFRSFTGIRRGGIRRLVHSGDRDPIDDVHAALQNLTENLLASGQGHQFVATVSTADLVTLLTERWAAATAQTNALREQMSAEIIDAIYQYRVRSPEGDHVELNEAREVLARIDRVVRDSQDQSARVVRPMLQFSDLIGQVFTRHGIKITDNLILGNEDKQISSVDLSAGEKQMLSFLSYNAFRNNGIFFIDEPELSLHAEWQRSLFPTLLSQKSGNQFIAATHSPFIYSKYPDKEFQLAEKDD